MAQDNLDKKTLLAYAAPAAPLYMLLLPLLMFLPLFYSGFFVETGQMEPAMAVKAVGGIFLIGRLWDALTDPIIGAMSDRTRSKLGRRKPWLLAGMVPIMVLGYILLVPQWDVTPTQLIILIAAFYAFWTMVWVPYQSWGAELSTDYTEKARIAGWREAGSIAGMLVAMGLPLVLVDPTFAGLRESWMGSAFPYGQGYGAVLKVMAMTMVVAVPVAILWATSKVHERDDIQVDSAYKLMDSLGVIIKNKPFLRLIAIVFLDQLGFMIFLTVVIGYLFGALGIQEFLLLVFIQHVWALALVPIWLKVAKNIGKHKAYALTLAFVVAGLIAMALIPSGSFWAVLFAYLLLGIGQGPRLILPAAIAADVIDYNTMKTGRDEAGIHMAWLNFTIKLCFALSVGISLGVFGALGFNPETDASPDTRQIMTNVAIIPPAVMLGLAALMVIKFPITSSRHKTVRRWIERRIRISMKATH